jgi:hypothetical protein
MSVELTVRVADAGEQAAVALLAAASLRIPENTVIVDRAYLSGTTNERQFGTMVAALTYIRQRAGTWRIVAGEGIAVPSDEDYYDLYDEGILFDSAFDPWRKFLLSGGALNLAELLYPVRLDRTMVTINL